MIATSLSPSAVVAGADTDLCLRLHNTGPIAYINIVLEFETPLGLLLVSGDHSIELNRLGPGDTHEHPIRVRASGRPSDPIVMTNFSYRDVAGRVYDAAGATAKVTVRPAPHATPAPRPPDGPPVAARTGRPSVFVSYKHADSPWFARAVITALRNGLPGHPVFIDDRMTVGTRWPDRLDAELRRCAAVVALIGPRWSPPGIILRREIEVTLERGICLLPVLFDGAPTPTRANLPDEIGALADLQAMRIDPTHFDDDMMRVTLALRIALA